MSDAPPPAPAPTLWQRAAPWLRYLGLVALGAVVSALAARFGLPAPPIDPGPAPVKADIHRLDTPLNYEGARFHGADDVQHAEADGRPFPGRDIRYWIDYTTAAQLRPALSNDLIAAAVRQAWGWWAEGLDISPAEVTDPAQAHLLLSFSPSVFGTQDGPLGVLAACEMGDGTTRQKRLIFDASERWTVGPPVSGQLSMPTVGCHEIGHFLGLGHDDPTAPAVMRPMYTSAIPREQARDVDRLVRLGYRRRDKAPSPPVDVLSVPVQIRVPDVVDALGRLGFKVTK